MMDRYFEFKYYEEIVGLIISAVLVTGCLIIPFAWTVFDDIKEWWKS